MLSSSTMSAISRHRYADNFTDGGLYCWSRAAAGPLASESTHDPWADVVKASKPCSVCLHYPNFLLSASCVFFSLRSLWVCSIISSVFCSFAVLVACSASDWVEKLVSEWPVSCDVDVTVNLHSLTYWLFNTFCNKELGYHWQTARHICAVCNGVAGP